MTDTDIRQKQQAEWLKTHTLTPAQLKQLFENKLRRAAVMHQALKQREVLCGDR